MYNKLCCEQYDSETDGPKPVETTITVKHGIDLNTETMNFTFGSPFVLSFYLYLKVPLKLVLSHGSVVIRSSPLGTIPNENIKGKAGDASNIPEFIATIKRDEDGIIFNVIDKNNDNFKLDYYLQFENTLN
jgi:hypothetical protein